MHPAIFQGLVAGLAFILIGVTILGLARLWFEDLTVKGEVWIVAFYSAVMFNALVWLR